ARFANLYGPTETNVCTYYRLDAPPEAADLPIPIGVACPFAQVCAVDDADHAVTSGAAGELLVRGESLMQGYWNRPDLDERAFVHVPCEGEGRFYRTGDLVRQRPDGNYDFLGRKDRQVKIRGYRVELDEVEHALATHPRVNEVAVYTRQIDGGAVQIEAAVVLGSGPGVDELAVRSYLAERLPAYAVPVNIHIVEQMPRTSTGKIDRQALEARHSTPAAGQ
ncbi:MAG: AMP-binding protein, partial [Candidatus Hydrogenedentes bacterium]|nr:AMP-binding protein [Candidatus Hydrogenedentota bacterium]